MSTTAGPSRRRRDDETARYRRVMLDRDRAAELTELLARAWPPRSLLELDGWRLRGGAGLPAYAASAWPRADGGRVALDVRLDGTRRYYDGSGLPARVLISDAARPAGTEAALAQDGWVPRHHGEIRTGPLDALLTLPASATVTTTASDADDHAWRAAWARVTGRPRGSRESAAKSLARVEASTCYVRAWRGEEVVGVARGLVDGGWLGVPDVAVDGGVDAEVATALVRAVAEWATAHPVDHVWWLVAEAGRGDRARDLGGAASAEGARVAGLRPAMRLHLRVATSPSPGPRP